MSFEEQTISADRNSAIEQAESNLNFFGALAITEIFRFFFPAVFLAIWQIITTAAKDQRGKIKVAIGIPRGFTKTTFLKLYVVWLVLFSDRKFVLIVCNTQDLAENFLADCIDILRSMNIVSLFGRWDINAEKDTLRQKKFNFRGRSIVLAAAGAGTSLRGLNIKFVRPDIIIMDDMQSREEAESVVDANRILTWMIGTLMKAASPERCLYIFVGNMYPFEGSILKKLKYNPAWTSFICGAILEDGQSIWPELKPVEELLTELEDDTSMGHPEIFYSEVMNDEEAGTRSGVDISTIKGVPADQLPEYPEAGFVIIDPSMGKKRSDDLVLGVILLYSGVPYLRELIVGKFTPQETVRQGLVLALKYNLPAIVVEGVSYQASLASWFEYFIRQLGIAGLSTLLIYPGQNSKVSRIITAFKMLIKRPQPELLLCEEVRSQVTYQITHFNPAKKDNKDDILDILAYVPIVMNQYRFQLTINTINVLEDENDIDTSSLEELALPF